MVYRQATRGKMQAMMARGVRWLWPTVLVLVLGVAISACSTPAEPVPTGEAPAVEDSGSPEDADTAPEESDTAPQPDDSPGPSEEPQVEPTVDINCTETNPHPIGQSIADTYDVTYEQVMTWFCLGDTFDDILIALETSEQTGESVEELLDMNREVGWEQVWEDLGLVEGE